MAQVKRRECQAEGPRLQRTTDSSKDLEQEGGTFLQAAVLPFMPRGITAATRRQACRERGVISVYREQSQAEGGCVLGNGMRGTQESEKTSPCPQCHEEVEEMHG